MLEGCAHIAGRLRVGADEPLHPTEIRISIKAGAGCGVFSGKQVMPRGLRIDLVNGCDHLAGRVGAKPDMMPARRAEARIVEDAGAGDDQLHRPPGLARRNSRQHGLHLQRVLLAEAAAGKGRNYLHLLGRESQRRRNAMSYGFGILRALMDGQLVALPFGNRGDQLDGILVLRRTVEYRLDPYRRFRESLVRIAGNDLGDEVA